MTHALLDRNNVNAKPATGLVRPLPPGPLDIIGDIHGEMDALTALMDRLGYSRENEHPEGRRLIFLGDFVDRGPDSAGVMEKVMALIERGVAYAVLGNHELNLFDNEKKADHNAWYFGSDKPELAKLKIDDARKAKLEGFMKSLPVAMEREDLRVVHAAWHGPSIDLIREESDAVSVLKRYKEQISAEFSALGIVDKIERELALQNRNPIKLLTSGPEKKADKPFKANGKLREVEREIWWDHYHEEVFVAFGHYWRDAPADFQKGPNLFEGYEPHHILGAGQAISIDYSVGARSHTKLGGTRLAALRWPERKLMFDDGQTMAIEVRVKK